MPDRLNDEDQATLLRLRRRLDRDVRGFRLRDGRRRLGFRALDAYYDGEQRLEQLGLAVPADLRDFVTIVGWPGTQVDTIAERCQVVGFSLTDRTTRSDRTMRAAEIEAGSEDPTEDPGGLWEVWQANNLDSESPMARIDALVFGRSYYCVGSPDEDSPTGDVPLVTVESPMQMTHEWSNRRRRVTAAARFYVDEDGSKSVQRATLYRDGVTTWLIREGRGWVVEDRDEHGLPVPVVPLVNRQRTHDRLGASQMGRIITLTDAAARALTNAQVATEVMALPQRAAAGMTQADFQDPTTGEQLTAWESYFGAIWATANKDAKFHQFSAADLGNFTKIVGHYAQLVSGLTGLPMRYLGQLSDNPPSADGIRADESRLVATCEAKNAMEADALGRVFRLVRWVRTGEDDRALANLHADHRNPATPTLAQAADAAVKLRQEGLVSRRQAQRDMGYTPAQIRTMTAELDAEARDPLTRALIDEVQRGAVGGDADSAA